MSKVLTFSDSINLRKACLWLALWLCSPLWLASTPVLASTKIGPKEPLMESDTLSFDETTNIITATGHVEVAMGDQILRADKITYNKNTDVVRAVGNIALTQASGEILYANEIEMTSDMKQAFLGRIGVLFPDNSRLVAQEANRYEGRYLITHHGVYTACNLCKKDPMLPPLWQVKGVRITHDTEEKRVIYRDAIVEFDGYPVFYTPYFSHPDSSVKRQQGFLAPTIGNSKSIGMMVRSPYYIDLAPHSDMILMPTISEEDKLQMAADWRYRFSNGSMRWQGSIARTDFTNNNNVHKGYVWRGHLFGSTQFDLSNTWRAGTKVAFSSDKSYLQRYKITSEDLLINRAYAENFSGRNYTVGNMYYFQDLRPGLTQKEPFVAPEIRYIAYGEPNATFGGRWSLGSSMLVTTREKDTDASLNGPNTRRLSLDAGWEKQMVSQTGFLTEVSLQARTDGYWADNVSRTDDAGDTYFDNVKKLRPFAQANLTVRYPMGRQGNGYQQILEPIAVFSAAPRLKNETALPNEDSLDVEFDETNLFSTNRFTGTDRLEGGTRVAYGIRNALIYDTGGKIDMLGGQIYRTRKDETFPEGSGLTDQFSDYVGRVGVTPNKLITASYGFRLSKHDLAFTRQQFSAAAGTPIFRPSARYLFSQETEASDENIQKLEEAAIGLSSNFTKYWTLTLSHTHAFKPAPGPRNTLVALTYKDECFEASISAERDHTVRTDLESGTTVIFRFFMKNIGGWGSD